MHPNAELAQELSRCVKSDDEELAILGLRRGLVIKDGTSFKLTKKGLSFMEKWGRAQVPKQQAAQKVTPTATPAVKVLQSCTNTSNSVLSMSAQQSRLVRAPHYGGQSYSSSMSSRFAGGQRRDRF